MQEMQTFKNSNIKLAPLRLSVYSLNQFEEMIIESTTLRPPWSGELSSK